MRVRCSTCLGLGLIPVLRPPMPCPDCRGRGYVEVEDEEDDIAPCFCGCRTLKVFYTVLNGWQVYCPSCGDETDGDVDKNEAIRWWNFKHQR